MKKSSQVIRGVAAALVSTTCMASVHAELVTFNFKATVTEVSGSFASGSVPVGSTLQGSFSWDTGTQPLWSFSQPAYASYRVPTSITATVNDHTIVGSGLYVDITDNSGGNVEDLLDVGASAPVVDGFKYINGSFGLRLGSLPGHTDGLTGTALPSVLDLAKLDSPYFTYGQLLAHGAPGGHLLTFQIDSVTAVPETDAKSMALAGLLSASLLLLRRRT